MRTFIIRARKGTTRWDKIRQTIGTKEHFEVIAHSVINAFFYSNGFRYHTEIYIVLDSSDDFPRTIKLSSDDGLSINGFHENAIVDVIEHALKNGQAIQKNASLVIAAGVSVYGYGFEILVGQLLATRPVYLLGPKGEDIRSTNIAADPIFILSDHLALPKNTVKSLQRRGLMTISLGKKMLFASQCITLIHHELDRSAII